MIRIVAIQIKIMSADWSGEGTSFRQGRITPPLSGAIAASLCQLGDTNAGGEPRHMGLRFQMRNIGLSATTAGP
jgi:hypothetical protein